MAESEKRSRGTGYGVTNCGRVRERGYQATAAQSRGTGYDVTNCGGDRHNWGVGGGGEG